MTDDDKALVDELRHRAIIDGDTTAEAADRITRLSADLAAAMDAFNDAMAMIGKIGQERTALRAENERLREGLTEIAGQKKTDELETEYDVEVADFEGGYDAAIERARAALSQTQARKGEEEQK